MGLKKQRGKGLRVRLKKNSAKDELLKVSVDKHVAHSKDLINPRHQYHALHPEGTKVEKLRKMMKNLHYKSTTLSEESNMIDYHSLHVELLIILVPTCKIA